MYSAHQTRPRGAALILSLTVTVVILIIIVGLVRNVLPFMLQSNYFTSANEAYFAAEAGLENALYDMSEQAQGYESVGPNDGRVPVAQTPSNAFTAFAQYLSANADDINFRTPSSYSTSTQINYSTDKFPDNTADDALCEFYNNDPYRYNFSKCCRDNNLNTYRHFCEDGVKKFGLGLDSECVANRTAGDYAKDNTCMQHLINFSTSISSPAPTTNTTHQYKGTSALGGYAIQSLTNIIPRPGEGTSPSRILDGGQIHSPRDWNKVTLQEPIQVHLAYQQDSEFGAPVKDSDIKLNTRFGNGICVNSPTTPPSDNLFLYIRLPLLDSNNSSTVSSDFLYDTTTQYLGDSTTQARTSREYDDVVLHWQVTGFRRTAGGTVDRSKSYTLSSFYQTSSPPIDSYIYESQINRITSDTLPNGTDPSESDAVLTLLSRGVPDLDFRTYAAETYNCGSGVDMTTPSIYQFIQLVHDPVLRVTMVSNPPLKENANLKPPYLEYQIHSGSALLPNPRAVIQGVGQTLRTEARQFTQTIQTTLRTDIAAPILDYIIFQ